MNVSVNIQAIESKLRYHFSQPKLLLTALTHPTYRNESIVTLEDNERLEFLGDAILCLIVTEHLFLLFPSMNEGTLSTARSSLISASSCFEYANKLGIGEHLLIGNGEKAHNEKGRASAYANLFEAILGAVYLDGGIAPTRQMTVPLLPSKEDIRPLMLGNPKNRLQQFTQKHLKTLPAYHATPWVNEKGESGYHICVFINGVICGEGFALTKKEAEKIAAQKALESHDYET